MFFPKTTIGRPFARFDARTGRFKLSTPDGGELVEVDMTGRILDVDLLGVGYGWLLLSDTGADWSQFDPYDWGPLPSKDHSPGLVVSVRSNAWAEPAIRELQSISSSFIGFVDMLTKRAGEVPTDKAVRVRITGIRLLRGKGHSAEIDFEVAPEADWPDRAAFVEAGSAAQPTVAPATTETSADDWGDAANASS